MADYTNPGAAATGALFNFLAEREAKKRQAMLDEAALAQQQWDRQFRTDQHAQTVRYNDANIANANAQTESLRAQRDAAIAEKDQKRALGVIGMLQPGAAVDVNTAAIIRQGGFSPLLQAPGVVAGMPREADADVAAEVDSALLASDPNALRTDPTFRGTPQQIALQQFLADPNVPDGVRSYMSARLAAGDENIPYQLFEGPETQALFRVSSNRRGIERFDGTGWVQHEGAIPKDAHWLTEPSAQSGEAGEMRRAGMFNRIADAYERSPLVRAADRTIVLKDTAERIINDPAAATNASTQLNLAYSYIQALDTYQSAVREGELANLGAIGTRLEVLGANVIRYLPREAGGQGQIMPPEVAREIAKEAQRLAGLMDQGRERKAAEFQRRAKASGVEDMWDATYAVEPARTGTTTPARSTAGAAQAPPPSAPANPFRR